MIKLGQRAALALIRQLIGPQQRQVDQSIQPLLLELLTPEDGCETFPAFLEEVEEEEIG